MTVHDESVLRSPPAAGAAPDIVSLAARFRRIRAETESLAAPLSPEDQSVQSMPDASPVKWHRAHTTWFFETFVLKRFSATYREFHASFGFLFNSYYEAEGARHPRPQRGLLTRPSAGEIRAYRAYVDDAICALLEETSLGADRSVSALVELGLHHEQQHQELILTDILHALAQNPLCPSYHSYGPALVRDYEAMDFIAFDGGPVEIGAQRKLFAFDNEGPRHPVLIQPYHLADRLVTNGEWLEFIADGGYRNPLLWLSDGWQTAQTQGWHAPLYWTEHDGEWHSMTLAGLRRIEANAPVVHVSYYEADAFARWKGKRLPSEAEWENAAARLKDRCGNFVGSGFLRPLAAHGPRSTLKQMFGDAWEWTRSPYAPYPGYAPPPGAVGEYNGKFMANQMVLRGGSCVTPADHIRASYRNFFYPHQRWQFMGVRLAEDARAQARRKPTPASPLLQDAQNGLAESPKRLPCKYFYDDEGSRLFDKICGLPEYYPTRTETALLKDIASELARHIENGTALVEFGSGMSAKTRILLDAAPQIAAYVPIDINASSLRHAAGAIAALYRGLTVLPLAADFTEEVLLPASVQNRPRLGFFPGSTIGNFDKDEAVLLLKNMRRTLGENARLLAGIDLVKPADRLLAAYDDAAGITAAFNKNILVRINRELGAGIDVSNFAHRVHWNESEQRIEMHLEALHDQVLAIGTREFRCTAGETIHTENAHKYTVEQFGALAAKAGWTLASFWRVDDPGFAIVLLR